MKVTVEYMGFFKIDRVPSGSSVEVEAGTSIDRLLDRLNVAREHRTYLRPIVAGERKAFTYQLKAGDDLFLYFPVGGG